MKDEKIVDLFINRNEEAIAACEDKYGKGLRTISSIYLDFQQGYTLRSLLQ